jgi:hypothetical protein
VCISFVRSKPSGDAFRLGGERHLYGFLGIALPDKCVDPFRSSREFFDVDIFEVLHWYTGVLGAKGWSDGEQKHWVTLVAATFDGLALLLRRVESRCRRGVVFVWARWYIATIFQQRCLELGPQKVAVASVLAKRTVNDAAHWGSESRRFHVSVGTLTVEELSKRLGRKL